MSSKKKLNNAFDFSPETESDDVLDVSPEEKLDVMLDVSPEEKSDFVLDVSPGTIIHHKSFGKGTIIALDRDIINVRFNNEEKKLFIKGCIEHQLVSEWLHIKPLDAHRMLFPTSPKNPLNRMNRWEIKNYYREEDYKRAIEIDIQAKGDKYSGKFRNNAFGGR